MTREQQLEIENARLQGFNEALLKGIEWLKSQLAWHEEFLKSNPPKIKKK